MMMLSTVPLLLSTLLLAALPASASSSSHSSNARRHHAKRASHLVLRLASNPTLLSAGSITAEAGCSTFYTVAKGDYCYKVADKAGITLQQLYQLNPQLDSVDCDNLWAGYAYCVAGVISQAAPVAAAAAAPVASPTPVAMKAPVVVATPAPSPASVAPVPVAVTVDAPLATTASSVYDAPAPAATPAAAAHVDYPAPVAAPAPLPVASTNSGANLIAAATSGITGFLGTNTDAIMSWFNPDSAQDSTNGNSWCGYPYNQNTPGFAPDVTTMLNNFGGDYEAAAKAYCGREAIVTGKDGRQTTLYLADGFDSKWVRTPSSIDIIQGSFAKVFGSYTSNKNDVVQGGSWYFTGNINSQYQFKSSGN